MTLPSFLPGDAEKKQKYNLISITTYKIIFFYIWFYFLQKFFKKYVYVLFNAYIYSVLKQWKQKFS